MDSLQWKKEIIKACKGVGTYKKEFTAPIETLAIVLEQRDLAYDQLIDIASTPLIINAGPDGRMICQKNPALQTWQDLNKEALNLWRELGLTPAGLKKITDLQTKQTANNLDKILKEMKK